MCTTNVIYIYSGVQLSVPISKINRYIGGETDLILRDLINIVLRIIGTLRLRELQKKSFFFFYQTTLNQIR